jgi:glucose-1-phosphate thymidylyltransferase
MLAGMREVLIISNPHDLPAFERRFGNGNQFGMRIEYCQQPSPDGLAQAFVLGEKFIDGQPSCLILGDNLFYGQGFKSLLQRARNQEQGATVFAYPVRYPERFGVVEFTDDLSGRLLRCASTQASQTSSAVASLMRLGRLLSIVMLRNTILTWWEQK